MDATQILASVVGLVGVAMGISPLLQVRRMVTRRSSADVSLAQLAVVVFGTVLWTSYGVAIANLSIIVSNGAGMLSNGVTLAFALHLRRLRAQAAVPAVTHAAAPVAERAPAPARAPAPVPVPA